ncbi:YesL family protein [Amphibacillus indicireducens]|uniref:DUF624 domain-containing protein n=1 Tax=Amphibacillus indicireducens TaxID=1076330 RepID=A0ABP7VHQ8_9BACI
MSKSIIERPIYQIINYIYAFFMTNLYFLLLISPFIMVYYLAEFTVQNILLYYVTLIPFGPAFAALLKTMDKLISDKAIRPTADFWQFFVQNFKVSIKYWLIQWTILVILIIDIYYANLNIPSLSIVFLIFILFFLLLMLYTFPILTRFEVKMKNLFVVSIYSMFRYLKVTLLNATTLIAFGIIYYAVPGITVLFFMSLICFFIMYNLQSVFKLLEAQFLNQEK